MTWHIRSTPILDEAIKMISRREGRSEASTIRRFVLEGVQARQALASSEPLPQKFDEVQATKEVVILRNMAPDAKAALRAAARIEDRSLAAMAKRLVNEALRQRGMLPAS